MVPPGSGRVVSAIKSNPHHKLYPWMLLSCLSRVAGALISRLSKREMDLVDLCVWFLDLALRKITHLSMSNDLKPPRRRNLRLGPCPWPGGKQPTKSNHLKTMSRSNNNLATGTVPHVGLTFGCFDYSAFAIGFLSAVDARRCCGHCASTA